jgi:hypothetical protein
MKIIISLTIPAIRIAMWTHWDNPKPKLTKDEEIAELKKRIDRLEYEREQEQGLQELEKAELELLENERKARNERKNKTAN